ncbi:ABC transporter permease [Psychromicrobium lacuslunae]|uniref:ABC transporter permease n=1 Tax=Psychromicrobium lacuslunae TaxID=1618207 RepID=A0A0D4BVN6_9MICC|nr:ABC transporter permease [Psychromicrobium lacuslunae]AJT40384.1 ABC transporter permease [Psychromicrobium lacuslunae]
MTEPNDQLTPEPAKTPPPVPADTSAQTTTGNTTEKTAEKAAASAEAGSGKAQQILREITTGPGLISVLAVVLALIVGALLIILTDANVAKSAGYFFSRPGDTFSAAWKAVSEAYGALIQGATFNPSSRTATGKFGIMETLTQATPLILAGLSVTVAFRAGLFNIGAKGQIILGAIFAGGIGFGADLPPVVHLLLVIVGGAVGGAIWGGVVGLLKARTGAHEVIVTIMLNYIAQYFLDFLLRTAYKSPGGEQPISAPVGPNAMFPPLFGDTFRVNYGLIMAIIAVILVAWLINRSTLGFELRAIGANQNAARTAGMLIGKGYILVMAIAGALAGLAGVAQLSGTEGSLDGDVAGSIGFDAITVALLGRSTPWGTFFAALLFGAFKAGGQSMAVQAGLSIDIVLVIQSLIVLFIAAPPLVRGIFGLGRTKRQRKVEASKEQVAA